MDKPSPPYHQTPPLQRVFGVGAIIFSVVGVILIAEWMNGSDTSNGYLGGLNDRHLLFNYHPIFMSLGMVCCAITATLSYRILPFTKLWTKRIHAFFHSCAIAFIVIGLTTVIVSNNYPTKYSVDDGYQLNFATLHDFLGLIAIILYFQNYVFGFLYFYLTSSYFSVVAKSRYRLFHVCFGHFTIYAALFALFTGIMELFTEVCPGIPQATVDNNRAATYQVLTTGCQIANGAALCFFFSVFLFALTSYDFQGLLGSTGTDPDTLVNNNPGGMSIQMTVSKEEEDNKGGGSRSPLYDTKKNKNGTVASPSGSVPVDSGNSSV